MVYEGDRAALSEALEQQRETGETVEYEYRVRCKNGVLMWVLDRGRLVTAEDGSVMRGYVRFDECTQNRYWTKEQISTRSLIANVLSTFLLKQRYKAQLTTLRGKTEDT